MVGRFKRGRGGRGGRGAKSITQYETSSEKEHVNSSSSTAKDITRNSSPAITLSQSESAPLTASSVQSASSETPNSLAHIGNPTIELQEMQSSGCLQVEESQSTRYSRRNRPAKTLPVDFVGDFTVSESEDPCLHSLPAPPNRAVQVQANFEAIAGHSHRLVDLTAQKSNATCRGKCVNPVY